MYDESNGHYNSNDGIFTSPIDGFYQFELNLVSLSEIYTMEIYLNDVIGLFLQFTMMHLVFIKKELCCLTYAAPQIEFLC